MHSFLSGWRRKAGVITLVMALAMLAAWMRGQIYADCFTLPYNTSSVVVATGYYGVGVEYSTDEGKMQPFEWRVFRKPPLAEIQEGEQYNVAVFGPEKCWRWKWGGITISRVLERRWVAISHWLFITPLTLLSAYLMLWKPRNQSCPI